ncbi:MAG: hypothetical protein MUO62_05840, partial [Anaerolineales bacterium]|nr:hypothetical protein [Anaerolineales bacterium]
MKKSATLLIAVVFLVAGYLVYNQYRPSNQDQNALENLETAVVQVGDLKTVIEATGIVRANHTATLSWETPGEVGSVEVEPGELVAQGQVLAALEQSSLLPNVILAQSDLYAA